MAYVGPVMSYYETITENWDRLTDERWKEIIRNDGLPQRPDWVNVYLTDKTGSARITGRELEGRAYTSANDSQQNLPEVFSLAQNYPNPFNSTTTIEFNLPKDGLMSLRIYDLRGRLIQTLLEHNLNAGHHVYNWVAPNLPSSIYLITLSSGGHTITRKTILVK